MCFMWVRNLERQEAFEKCWANSPLRAFLHCHSPGVATVARRHCRMPPAHRCPRQRQQQQQQRMTRGDHYGPIEWAQKGHMCTFI